MPKPGPKGGPAGGLQRIHIALGRHEYARIQHAAQRSNTSVSSVIRAILHSSLVQADRNGGRMKIELGDIEVEV